ncbi:MAG: PfkB family carbohydrate kinase [Candidatus Omnitrophica bacterium]|nr:PfkB family carbohydrate kinase [Candidatus Omnitrophota bacterium]MDD5724963.1 PfkB family carbohydrate kinase [Candidatus Omnitrophota bacterium]
MDTIVLGTVALDNVKTPCGMRRDLLGGSAVHFSMAARFFTRVSLVAIVGKDFPSRHINFLKKKGVNLDSLTMDPGETFRWEGSYEGDLNSALTLHTRLGVLSTFKPFVSETQRKIGNIFLANVDPDIQEELLCRMRKPRLVGLDSMNYWINSKPKSLVKLLKRVDIYVANDQEARVLSGENNLIKAAKSLYSLGAKMVLIKKGEHGVLFYGRGFIFSLPAYPVEKVVDPTGAGDTFAGGFMGYLSSSRRIDSAAIKKALAYGTVAASFNVEDFGVSRTSRLTRADLERRLAKFKRCFSF